MDTVNFGWFAKGSTYRHPKKCSPILNHAGVRWLTSHSRQTAVASLISRWLKHVLPSNRRTTFSWVSSYNFVGAIV